MAFFKFNSRVKNQKFKYIPRFYDPEKEALQERLEAYNDSGEIDKANLAKSRIRAGLRSKSGYSGQYRGELVKKSNLRLVMIILVLCMLTYLLLTSRSVGKLVETFLG